MVDSQDLTIVQDVRVQLGVAADEVEKEDKMQVQPKMALPAVSYPEDVYHTKWSPCTGSLTDVSCPREVALSKSDQQKVGCGTSVVN